MSTLLVIAGLGVVLHSAGAQAPAKLTPSQELARLAEEFGRRRQVGGLDNAPSLVIALAQNDSAFGDSVLRRANAIAAQELSHEEELTHEILKWEAWKLTQSPGVFWYSFQVNPSYNSTNLTSLQISAGARSFASEADLTAYLSLIDQAGTTLARVLQKTRDQGARGIMLPRGQADILLPYYQPLARAATDNPFSVVPSRLTSFPAAHAEAFRTMLSKRIANAIVPPAQGIVVYLDRDVRQRGPTAVGLSQYPGGKEAERTLLKFETTLPSATPESLFTAGMQVVAEIDSQMARVRDSLGFRGTKAEFDDRLRRDPRFYAKTPEEFGARLMMHARRIEPIVSRYFSGLPKAPYGVKRLDPLLEPTMTYGIYASVTPPDSVGYYTFNGSDLDKRSMLTAAGLIYHELIPGHHLEVNLSSERNNLPLLRRRLRYPGYGEGWAEYASSVLAREAGLYSDVYDLYGRLGMDAFAAARRVADIGMNYYGWPRERAVAFLKEHTLESDVQIESESWRYSVRWPGQAVAFRTGQDVFLALRQKAERELGPHFDIRHFHDAVLGSGRMPLYVLQRHVDWWIQQEQKERLERSKKQK